MEATCTVEKFKVLVKRENNCICISLGASELHTIPNDVQLVKERI